MFEYAEKKLLNVLLFIDLLSLDKNKNVSPAHERRVQNKRLRILMKKAYAIPFYRKKFDSVGMKPSDFKCVEDLEKFPLLTKQELREWMNAECKKSRYKNYYLDSTSGSSGTPTKILYSPREKAYNMANWMRMFMKGGYDPFREKTVSRLSVSSETAQQKNALQRFGILRREFINQYESEETVIRNLNSMKPGLLYMNKTEFMRIALYAKKHDIQVFHPRFFIPIGEKIEEVDRKLLAEVFGGGMIDSFGTTETGACMVKYPGDHAYRIHGDLFAVNVFDAEGKHAETGKLTVTPLYKTDIPLINYVVGDEATLRVINGKPRVTEVKGRMNDVIRHRNGEVTTFFMISPIFAHSDDIVQVRLIQKSYDELVIQAVRDTSSAKEIRQIESEVGSQVSEKLRQPMEIHFNWVDVIPPDPNGKLKIVINEMENSPAR